MAVTPEEKKMKQETERIDKNIHSVEELNRLIANSFDNPDVQRFMEKRKVSLIEMQQIFYKFAQAGWRVIHVENDETGKGKYEILNPDKSEGLGFDYNIQTRKITRVYSRSI